MAINTVKTFQKAMLAAVIAVSPIAAKAETLAEALVGAYQHSGLLDQNRALLRAADENVAQIVSELRPIVNWSSDITQNFGRIESSGFFPDASSLDLNFNITASLLLYDFGQTKLRKESAKETVLATRQTLLSIEQQVLFRAVQAFMDVRRNNEFVALRQNNVALLEQELRAAQDRFEVGEVTRTDVAQAEARLAAALSGLAVAQGDLAQAVEEFRASVGRRPGNLQSPKSLPHISGDVEGAKSVAVRNHPDMRRVQHEVAAADLTVLAADAATRPQLDLTGQLGASDEIGGSDNSRTGSVGIQLSGPIYQGGLLSSITRQAIAQRDAARGALHDTRHDIARDVGNAYAILQAARATKKASSEQVRAAEVAFTGVQEEAKLGARTTLDVLDAEQELLDARTNLVSADTDVTIAAYGVLSSIGQLTAKDLKLDVQTYDPAAYYNLVKDAPVKRSKQGQQLDKVLRALGQE